MGERGRGNDSRSYQTERFELSSTEIKAHDSLRHYALESGGIAPDPHGQLHVLHHDGAALGVDGQQVRVLHQNGQVHLSCLLKDAGMKIRCFTRLLKLKRLPSNQQ